MESRLGRREDFAPALWHPNRARAAETEVSERGLSESNTKIARRTGRGAEALGTGATGQAMHSHEPASSTGSMMDVRATPRDWLTEQPSHGLHDVRNARIGGAGVGDSPCCEPTGTDSDSPSPDPAGAKAVVHERRSASFAAAQEKTADVAAATALRAQEFCVKLRKAVTGLEPTEALDRPVSVRTMRRSSPGSFREKPRGALAVVVEEQPIQSHRHLGEALWHPLADVVVICDGCGSLVEHRRGGGLVAKPGRSRFARDRFLCCRCMRGGSGYPKGLGM